MEVICDTNIWYYIGNDLIDKSILNVNDKFIATFNSLEELSFTENLIINYEYAQNAVKAMFNYSSENAIFEPPFVYLKVINDKDFYYDIKSNHNDILTLTKLIAKGHTVEKVNEFYKAIIIRKQVLENASFFFNDYVKQIIQPNLKDKKKHRHENSIPLNRELIRRFVEIQSNSTGLSQDFNWVEVELFENVLKLFFNEIETGAKLIKPNDWFDLFLLVYVNPNRKIWTREKYWIGLIKKAGMEKYLYEN